MSNVNAMPEVKAVTPKLFSKFNYMICFVEARDAKFLFIRCGN